MLVRRLQSSIQVREENSPNYCILEELDAHVFGCGLGSARGVFVSTKSKPDLICCRNAILPSCIHGPNNGRRVCIRNWWICSTCSMFALRCV